MHHSALVCLVKHLVVGQGEEDPEGPALLALLLSPPGPPTFSPLAPTRERVVQAIVAISSADFSSCARRSQDINLGQKFRMRLPGRQSVQHASLVHGVKECHNRSKEGEFAWCISRETPLQGPRHLRRCTRSGRALGARDGAHPRRRRRAARGLYAAIRIHSRFRRGRRGRRRMLVGLYPRPRARSSPAHLSHEQCGVRIPCRRRAAGVAVSRRRQCSTRALWELYPEPVRKLIAEKGGLSDRMIYLAASELAKSFSLCRLTPPR